MKRPWLLPFVPLYAAGVALRARRFESGRTPIRRLKWPVISIGNLSAGGTGKTPLAIALARLLTERGIQVDVLSRGYGRVSKQALRVDPRGAIESFGDEPLLIVRSTGVPVYVAPERYDAGVQAEADVERQQGSSPGTSSRAHVLDDGFQHRQLHRDIDILLLSRHDLQDTLLPAGNLREPLVAAERASALVIPADDASLEADLRARGLLAPIWRIRRIMEIPELQGPVFAFCGIARPEQFFSGLEAAGVHISERMIFRDHHQYRAADVNDLVDAATLPSLGIRTMLTTEKDAVRFGSLVSALPPDLVLKTVPLRVEMEDAPTAIAWLLSRLNLPS